MKTSLSTDTLAYQLGVRPALQFRDMSAAPLRKVVEQLNAFMALTYAYDWLTDSPFHDLSEKPQGIPEKDALVFYMLNHAISCIRQKYHVLEPLPKEVLSVLNLYHEQMALRGTRMFYYLLLICVRESRHANGPKNSVIAKDMEAKYTSSVVSFHGNVESLSESAAVASFQQSPPDVPLRLWVNFMSDHFRQYSYGSSFGGELWANIADVVRDYSMGKTTLEMLLDTSFTLSHNTSPAFDKGMLYTHYNSDLMKILDVQRAGQIPQLVVSGGVNVAKNSADVKAMLAVCEKAIPDFAAPFYVDWYKVEALGSESKYPMEKKQQAAKHGVPKDTKAKKIVQEVKEALVKNEQEQEALATVAIFAGLPGGQAQTIKKVARNKS